MLRGRKKGRTQRMIDEHKKRSSSVPTYDSVKSDDETKRKISAPTTIEELRRVQSKVLHFLRYGPNCVEVSNGSKIKRSVSFSNIQQFLTDHDLLKDLENMITKRENRRFFSQPTSRFSLWRLFVD